MTWTSDRYAIHVFADDRAACALVAGFTEKGARRLDLDIGDLTDRSQLVERLKDAFQIPYPMGGLDGALDWLSDLEWLNSDAGYVVLVRGFDDAEPTVRRDLATILPFVLDRWREATNDPYVFTLVANTSRDSVLDTLTASNRRLEEIGRRDTITHTAPVPVIVDGQLVDPKLTHD